jgi:hypothetical protein
MNSGMVSLSGKEREMPNIHDVFKDEDVSGVIVGGDFVCAKLCYEGRQQGRQIYADDVAEALGEAVNLKKELINDLGRDLAKEIYPCDDSWKIVFLN